MSEGKYMSSIRSRKKDKNIDTKVVNLGKLDPQSCAEVNGELTENRDCMVKKKTDSSDPDRVVLEKMHYQKPPSSSQQV
jgi:hypothetical protein